MERSQVDAILFAFLRTSYLFEKREESLFGLSWQEVYALQLLRKKGPLGIGELRGELRQEKYQTTRLVDHLEREGLVERGAGPAGGTSGGRDRRRVAVRLLPGGAAKLETLESYHYELFSSGERAGGPGMESLLGLKEAMDKFSALVGIE